MPRYNPHILRTLFQQTALLTLLVSVCQLSSAAELANGPMLGPISIREAKLWVQTDQESFVRIHYQDLASGRSYWSAPRETAAEDRFATTLVLSEVEPGRQYSYQVEVNGTLIDAKGEFETPAYYYDKTPAPDLRIAVVGSHYRPEKDFEPPYQTLGEGFEAFTQIAENDPDLVLWTGNTAHLRQTEWSSRSGYLKRFSFARAQPELKPLLANTPNLAVWGNGEYGPEQAGLHFSNRSLAEKAFRTFWPQPNESNGLGLTGNFRISDVEFFFLDVQSFRRNSPESDQLPQALGAEQIEWLRQSLIHSTATFKIIVAGAPILNPANNPDNLSFADREQKQMLQKLREAKISGLFFISGGKAYGELTRLVHANSYNLYDLTVGPITAEPAKSADELNFFRMPGTSSFVRHFALIDISGREENRTLSMRVLNAEGIELWSESVRAAQLKTN